MSLLGNHRKNDFRLSGDGTGISNIEKMISDYQKMEQAFLTSKKSFQEVNPEVFLFFVFVRDWLNGFIETCSL